MLASTLVACDSGSEQAQVEQAADAQPAETQPAPVEDRFANMFVPEISDTFNPGVQVGDTFPAISALYQGEEIMSIDRFVRDKGAIFIAVRSVDW